MSNNLVYTKRLIRKSSSRIIIPLIISLSLVIRSSLFIRRRAAEDYSSVDASNGIAIVLIFLSLPYIFSTKGIQVIKLLFKSKIRIYLYFVLWSLVSVLWSTNVIYSAFRGVELLINLFLIGYIFYNIPSRIYAKKILMIYFLISIVAGIGFYFKHFGFSFVNFHTNSYSMIAAAAIIIGYGIKNESKSTDPFKLKRTSIVLMAVSIFCLIVGTSGASNASFLFVILFLFVMKRNSFISFLFLFLVSLISYFLWISFQDQILNIVFPGKKLESIQTGTGRKGMWAIYLDGFLQKPIFGFGFPTGEKEGDRFGWMVTSSSHNMLISAAINSGIIGLSLLLAFLIKYYNYCRKMWLVLGYTEFRWILGGFLIIAINSLSLPAIGSTWMWMTSPIYCLFVYSVFNYKLKW